MSNGSLDRAPCSMRPSPTARQPLRSATPRLRPGIPNAYRHPLLRAPECCLTAGLDRPETQVHRRTAVLPRHAAASFSSGRDGQLVAGSGSTKGSRLVAENLSFRDLAAANLSSATRRAACGRVPVATNGCSLDAQRVAPRPGRPTASGNVEWRQWVNLRPSRDAMAVA